MQIPTAFIWWGANPTNDPSITIDNNVYVCIYIYEYKHIPDLNMYIFRITLIIE